MNKTLLKTEIQNANSSLTEVDSFIKKIKEAQVHLTDANRRKLIDLTSNILILQNKTHVGINEIAEKNGIGFYKTVEFRGFLKAAEDYIKIIENPTYPTVEDNCIYCSQPLNLSAKDLLASYRNILNDNTEQNLIKLKSEKANIISEITKVYSALKFNHPTFGVNTEMQPNQPNEITNYNFKIATLKSKFISDTPLETLVVDVDYPATINFLNEKKDSLLITIQEKKESLDNLSTKENELKSKIGQLKDRKILFGKKDEVKEKIKNHKVHSALNSNSSSFNTTAISRKTTEARESLVRGNFETKFKLELKELRKGNIDIQLNFGTDRGNSKISHKINNHNLLDILSEGEQKAIALAEFLTELQLDNSLAPVIFDDPVNSLDHNMIDDVARRLLKLSNDRQVIIFTHSVLLFNSILTLSKIKTYQATNCQLYTCKKEYEETGFIAQADEINSISKYIAEINKLISNTTKDRPETEVAEDGYGYLRSAIELLVEHDIFQGTVKRYQKNISLTQFVKIDGAVLNEHKDKLNEIFERSCGFIKGHSNPIEIYVDPTMDSLKSDYDDFKRLDQHFLRIKYIEVTFVLFLATRYTPSLLN